MGLFDFFKANSGEQFVTEKQFSDNSETQVRMAPETLKQLRDIGVDEDKELKLEFFFYSNSLDKVGKLSDELKKLGYDLGFGPSSGDKKLFVSTGWTTKMRMDNLTVKAWAHDMCEVAYKFDCEFDGWGTTPDQD